jgi:hypothetical protein
MKLSNKILYLFFIALNLFVLNNVGAADKKIGRKAIVQRNRVITTATNPKSPAQVGNGEFAIGVDITGLQTFESFNTMSHWSWHSLPLPNGLNIADFAGKKLDTHGRMVQYDIQNPEQPELSAWLAENPHRFNLGRIGFQLLKVDGTQAKAEDLTGTHQEIDLWEGIIYSTFYLEGKKVSVKTACHPSSDVIGVSVKSELVRKGQIKVFFYFPYPIPRGGENLSRRDAHTSVITAKSKNSIVIARTMDDAKYNVSIHWDAPAKLLSGDTISTSHRFYLKPTNTDKIDFTCGFAPDDKKQPLYKTENLFAESCKQWPAYWEFGAAIDLSQSKDVRWKELERRIVLSQYLMKVNEAGSYPPQEAGLVRNGWFGRFHFEMIWWHGVHYSLWNRWPLFEKSLHVYQDFLPTSTARAEKQGYLGARWPKCTGDLDREWPHPIHALLIWQQPHPIYFAELDYRLHPTKETLEKWKDVVASTANFMADYAYFDKETNRYVLGPPIHIVSENTKPEKTMNPAFELGYWRFGLRTAQIWRERLGLAKDAKWDNVLKKLSPLPKQDGLYLTHEGIDSMWTKYNFEHPALIGTYGMLPGDGVDTLAFKKTLDKVLSNWRFQRTWGWDFPMLAMAAARSGKPEAAIDMLLNTTANFQFDEHGLATGGPFPYFPSNGGLLTAIAMMAEGWDGSKGDAPGFPKDGSWVVKYEGFNKMP